MLKNHNLLRVFSLAFIILIGYALAKAINAGSTIGVLLALVSLGAVFYFFYTVNSLKKEMDRNRYQ